MSSLQQHLTGRDVRMDEIAVFRGLLASLWLIVPAGCSGQPAVMGGAGASGGATTTGGAGTFGGAGLSVGGTSASVGGGALGTGGTPDVTLCQVSPSTAPKLTAPTTYDATVVARAAVALGSCIPDDGIDRNATHIWSAHLSATRDYFMNSTQLGCLANANCGCAAVEHCIGYRLGPAPVPCVSGCSGSLFTACGDPFDLPTGYSLTLDCGKLGMNCDNSAVCVTEPAVACDGSTYTPSCDAAGNPRYCDDGFVRQGANCAALGLDCVGGKCAGRGNACTNSIFSQPETIELEGTACSGSTLTACVSGRLATLDCATLGPNFTCQTLGGQFFCGLSNECVPASNYARSTTLGPTCNSSNITFCNAGRVESIDCRTLGFTRCEVNTSIEHYGCL